LLGSPNDNQGNLLSLAHERVLHAISEYKKTGFKILPTGGFGEHFNTSDKPHAYYLKQNLISLGIPEIDILEFALSANTFEDAKLSKQIIDRTDTKNIHVVSSDFHLERVRIIFEKEFIDYHLSFSGSTTHLAFEDLEKLKNHEKKAINYLLKN